MSTEIAKSMYTPEQLELLAQYSKEDGTSSSIPQLPKLKINYVPMVLPPEEAMAQQRAYEMQKKIPLTNSLPVNYVDTGNYTIPLGAYVVGQKKDKEGKKVVEQGQEVDKIVILKVRNQFNYFDESNIKNSCYSPIHEDFQKVCGSNYGYECGTNCPLRAKDRKPRCSAQKVLFVSAITKGPNPTSIDAVMFAKGVGFMPATEYIKAATEVVGQDGKKSKFPTFSFLTVLKPPLTDTKGAITYYIPQFSKGVMFDMATIEKFRELNKKVDEYIEAMNARMKDGNSEEGAEAEVVDGGAVQASAGPVPPTGYAQPLPPSGHPQVAQVVNPVQHDVQTVEEEEFDVTSLYR